MHSNNHNMELCLRLLFKAQVYLFCPKKSLKCYLRVQHHVLDFMKHLNGNFRDKYVSKDAIDV